MEIVQQISKPVLEFGDKLGFFLIPLLVIASLALFVISIYSYGLLKIVLPALGLVAGYYGGTKVLGPVIANFFEGAGFITPELIGGVICALILAFICFKSRKTTLTIIGLTVGYFTISGLIHTLLRGMKFVQDILINTTMDKAIIFSTIISITCALVMMYFCLKHFKLTYVFGVSIACAVAAFAVPAIFIFKSSANFEICVLIFAGLGAFLGLIFGWNQYKNLRYMCDD